MIFHYLKVMYLLNFIILALGSILIYAFFNEYVYAPILDFKKNLFSRFSRKIL